MAGRAASAPEEREEYGEILLAARRLRRLVKNLLDVSRLESGALKPKLDWCDLGMLLKGLWLLPGKHAGIIPCLFPCRRTIRW